MNNNIINNIIIKKYILQKYIKVKIRFVYSVHKIMFCCLPLYTLTIYFFVTNLLSYCLHLGYYSYL